MPAVLIVDDDTDNRELLRLILGRAGYHVTGAADAAAAAELLAAERFDAVLLDVRMPGTVGTELCRRLRADATTATLPIMMISAYAAEQDVAAGLAAGADDYLTKPYHRCDLLAGVEALLRRAGRPVRGLWYAGARAAQPQPAAAGR